MSFQPFDDQGESCTIDGMTIENGSDRIAVYGRLSITRDQAGLENARALRELLDAVVHELESQPHLPEKITVGLVTHPMENPFG
ncbi:hypothetical protein DY926_09925 [Komagataeibacter melaceti]|uniref:Uncharacterized protein n=1 Tax=Komagataeibacter melaceti TaxID=2766577 RepID=A0A371YZS6_9PROT|nr:hypothetical protein [Komagataeibacter melaceti]RFD19707.1 hypothetical protein DY926_09925 [Komagataeibacter melaceti]